MLITPIRSLNTKKNCHLSGKVFSRAFQSRLNFSNRSRNDWITEGFVSTVVVVIPHTNSMKILYNRDMSRSKSDNSWPIWKIQTWLKSSWKDLFGKLHWIFCIWTPYGSNLHKKWEASAQWLLDLYVSGHVYCSLKREKWICIRQISQKYAGGSCLTP